MLRRWFRRWFPDPRADEVRESVYFGALLELDVVDIEGIARDVGSGGLFFATSAPIAPGVRGALRRPGSALRIPVRVTWQRAAATGRPAGLGLAFE